MVYKTLNGLAPDYVRSMFTDRGSVTSYSLRDTEGKLAIPKPRTNYRKDKHWKTSFEKKNCFSAWASTLNIGLINKGWYGMFVACGIWCLADVSSVSPSSEQTGELWGNQCLNSW